ncbi:hypothetical protein RUND412_008952 [Rhizina undulata]
MSAPSTHSSKVSTDARHIEDTKHDAVHIETLSDHTNGKTLDATALAELDSIETTQISRFVWLVTLAAAIGGFLFGYDTGVISGVLVVLSDDLGHVLSSSEKELVTSLTSGGAFIGAIFAGMCADRWGRKPVIAVGCVAFTIGAVLQAASFGLVQMAVGRFVIGTGVGLAAMVVPVYIGELAPSKYRGRMVTIDALCITGGQMVSYAIGAAFENVVHGWRYMIILGAVPALMLLFLLPILPETPRQLLNHDRPDAALEVLRKIYPAATQTQLSNKIQHLTYHIHVSTSKTPLWHSLKMLYTTPSNLRALIVTCGLMAIQQLCGFNSLMYYSATLFALVGFKNAIAVGLVVAGTNFLGTIVSFVSIDRFGRRRVLVGSMWGMAVGLGVCAAAFKYLPISSDLEIASGGSGMGWPGIVVLVSIVVYVAFYAVGLGNVPWQANELLPMEVRAVGVMMVTCTCWGCNIIISATFLSLMKGITPTGAFALYAAICFVGWIAVILCYPEVAGMTLEEITRVFRDSFGVAYAREWRKTKLASERISNDVAV